MKRKKLTSIIIMCSMIAALLVPAASHAANFSDTNKHWAASYIDKAVEYGFVQGYPDNTFRPDRPVTRAEFTTMLNKALGNTATASITFSDVPYAEWFYQDVAKAYAATYVGGYEDNTFKPNSAISRQEAAVMISRVIPAYGISGNLNEFPDRSSVADWAYTAFQKVNGKKYIGAYDDGRLHPLDNLTRAQTAKIICDILDNENIVKSDPVIRSSTTLTNTIYSNSVTISSDTGSGSATIENCIILGNLIVQGGSSVSFSNSRASQATVERSSSSVTFTVRGESVIAALTAAREATIQTSGLTGGLYGRGIDILTTLSSSNITLQGTFPKVTVNGSSAKFRLSSGSITNLTISSSASRSDITIDSGASVSTVDVNAESYFHGTGTINTMNVYANGVTYEQKPGYVNTGSQYTAPNTSTATSEDEIKFSPANGATRVDVDTKITITFNSEMTLYNGNSITSSNIEDFVELRESTSVGTRLNYDASISSRTKITITPENNLKDNTKYYVIIPRNSVKDSDGKGNAAQSISFSTGNDSSLATFYPTNNTTNVSTSIKPTITFSEEIEPYSGSSSLNNQYFRDRVVILRENDEDGDDISFSASYNSSSRVVTITPNSNLSNGQYYIGIADRSIRTVKDRTRIEASAIWVVGSVTAVVTNITPTKQSNTSLKITAEANFAGTMYFLLLKPSDTKPTTSSGVTTSSSAKSVTVSKPGGTGSWTFSSLDPNLTYTYYVILKVGSSTYSSFAAHTYAMTPAPTHSISLSQSSQHTFPAVKYGYSSPPTALTVTVTNTGSSATGRLTIELGGGHPDNFTLSPPSNSPKIELPSIDLGGTSTFTVTPKPGLNAGDYTATVMVSGANIATPLAFNVSIKVEQAELESSSINWPTDLAATEGQTLANVHLPIIANGTFAWVNAGTSVGGVGTQNHELMFAPSDSNYKTVTQSVSVEVFPVSIVE
ncbi:MAG: S-layer homology domain-containing protein [Clostridiales bacterium]|nr:S-layer homology domain-containing protein [Clostridiales bacterium]